jgi:hypothetical protein
VGLGTSSLLVNHMDTNIEGEGVSVCPGPNMASFSKVVSLREMAGHIYGRNNILTGENRQHMFVKELGMYIDFLKARIEEAPVPMDEKQERYFTDFSNHLKEGIRYYRHLFSGSGKFKKIIDDLLLLENGLERIMLRDHIEEEIKA